MNKHDKIYVAGHRGMVGSALVRKLQANGFSNIIVRTSDELNLCNQGAVNRFFMDERPKYVFLAAARVGGIMANSEHPAEFIYENLMIQSNVIHAAYLSGVTKLLFLGSSCIYPKMAPQPLQEDYLLTGSLEPTNEPYAIAKLAGIKLCEAYRRQYNCNFVSVLPTNLYGPNDNYDLQNSHVLPALIRKFHEAVTNKAETVEIWGSGAPRREFLHVDDLADACIFLMDHYDDKSPVNIGVGRDISIKELALLLAEIISYDGKIVWNTSKPDGTPRKLLNVEKIQTSGWRARIPLKQGIEQVYNEVKRKGFSKAD